jgi:hypothetical protein
MTIRVADFVIRRSKSGNALRLLKPRHLCYGKEPGGDLTQLMFSNLIDLVYSMARMYGLAVFPVALRCSQTGVR